MSLINDALKRAQEAQRPNVPSGMTAIRAVHARSRRRPIVGRLLVAVIFLLLAAAFAFIGLAMTGRLARKNIVAPPASTPHAVAAASQPVSTPAAPAKSVAATPVAQSKPASMSVTATNPPASTVAIVAAPALQPLVLPDTLHVQGIAYDPVHPWAIVSSKMVYIGDMVKGVRVMQISKNSVTFGSHGQTNLLYVGQ